MKITIGCVLTVMAFSSIPSLFTSCAGKGSSSESDSDSLMQSIQVDSIDSLIVVEEPVEEPKVNYSFTGTNEILEFIRNKPDAALYNGGIIPVMARFAPKYANKLLSELETYSSFIVVDKASMRVLLYDKYGQTLKEYGMACAKNYGTKHMKADSRTPEGFFSIEGKYDSTDWLFTDDDGHTSKKKGQFGPRFLRIRTPISMQIGIHGTGSPWSIGHRVSHGCIRITNENIMELFDLVERGMPVIVLPGKRDRAVNREEGYDIAYFPTAEKYAMSEAEKALKVNPEKFDPNAPKDTVTTTAKTDSIEVRGPGNPDNAEVKESEETKGELPVDSVRESNRN
ncbi:MAG: L,D-transpeptidase family protein [Muribaculaceae bacterium]|nr:L,D-transpeptidase family protein [Muribaculaceae bacterium]